MKKIVLFVLFLVLAMPAFCEEQKLTFKEILAKMEYAGDYKTSSGKAKMEIIGDDTTEMELIMYEERGDGDEDDKQLMRFTSPPRLKGTAILMVGNNIWYYNNRTNRVRLLSSSAKKESMMGSSFSYEDLEISYSEDFNGEILSEDRNYYKLKLIPKKEKEYEYLIIKTRKSDFIVETADYYKDSDIKYKESVSKDIKEINNRKVPLLMEMKDIEENKVTRFIVDEKSIEYDVELDNNIFSEENLKTK